MTWMSKRALRELTGRLDVQNTIITELRTELLRKHCGFALPPVGLPWRNVDCDGDQLQIRRAEDDPNAIIISTAWKTNEPGHTLVTSAALDTWELRTKAAAAILAMGPPDAAELRPPLSLVKGAG